MSVVGSEFKEVQNEVESLLDTSILLTIDGKSSNFYLEYLLDGTLLKIESDFGVSKYINDYLASMHFDPSHYHLCCRAPLKPFEVINRLVQLNYPFSIDFILSSIEEQLNDIQSLIPFAKYIFVNEKEYCILKEKINLTKLNKVIVTSGAHPVKVFQQGELIIEQECPKVEEIQDVTGAGDVLVGTVLGLSLKGTELGESIRKGILAAQNSLQHLGVSTVLLHKE